MTKEEMKHINFNDDFFAVVSCPDPYIMLRGVFFHSKKRKENPEGREFFESLKETLNAQIL